MARTIKRFLSVAQVCSLSLMWQFLCSSVLFTGAETIELPPPFRVREILLRGTASERSSLVKSLRLVLPSWMRGGRIELPCLEYQSVELHSVVLEPPNEQAVLMAKPEDCEAEFLIVMDQETPNHWVHRSSLPLFAKYSPPQVSFVQLVNKNEHEIMVRNHTVDYGTGILQKNLTIFKFVDQKLRVIFDQPERLVFAIPTTRNGKPDNTDQAQESSFWFVDSSGTGIRQIVEKQVIRDHKLTILRWRIFSWSSELQVFQGSSTDGNFGEKLTTSVKLGPLNPN